MWSAWQPDRNVFFNSYFLEAPGGNVAVDPLPLDERDAAEIEARGGLAWVVVTNRDHERAAADVAKRFGAKVAASEADAPLLRVPVDRKLEYGDRIGPATVIALDGLKTAGEIALLLPALRTLILGDALWGDPAGSLRLLPDEKLLDPRQAALSIRRLRALRPLHIFMGDGSPIIGTGYESLNACLEARGDVELQRVNFDELAFRTYPSSEPEPPEYAPVKWAEVGQLIGATHLGYAATRMPPGTKFCPLHWHTAEEELFIVWEGTPTLRTPHGTTVLRRGDIIAFPTRAFGAHQLINEADTDAVLLLIANSSPYDNCFYPDSNKVLVEATGLIVRAAPELNYYDGED